MARKIHATAFAIYLEGERHLQCPATPSRHLARNGVDIPDSRSTSPTCLEAGRTWLIFGRVCRSKVTSILRYDRRENGTDRSQQAPLSFSSRLAVRGAPLLAWFCQVGEHPTRLSCLSQNACGWRHRRGGHKAEGSSRRCTRARRRKFATPAENRIRTLRV